MISSYELTLKTADGAFIPYECAYRLYSWLLTTLSEDEGDILHEQGVHPISQYLVTGGSEGAATWHISLLNDTAHRLFAELLESTEHIELHGASVDVCSRSHSQATSPAELVSLGRFGDSARTTLQLRTPTAFKQNGHYVIFPQERLIVQSLVRSWSQFCPEFPMEDSDAIKMLEDGLRITSYSLHSTGYKMKNTVVPGFSGKMTVSPRLSAPMQELWSTLLAWSEYAGIGIKTTLGMGGVTVLHDAKE